MDDQTKQSIVTQSIPSQQPTTQPPTNSQSKLKPFLLSLLIVVVLAAVGYGMYYWQQKKVSDANTKVSILQSQVSSLQSQVNKLSKQTSAQGDSSTSSNTKYLDIPEEGIKFQLSSEITDAYYVKNSNGYIYLSVHKFDNNGGLAGCSASTAPNGNLGVVALIVAKPGQPGADEANDPWTLQTIHQAGLTQVGDTYYGFQKGNGPCYDVNASDASSEATQYGAVEQAFIAAQPTITKL